MSYLFAFALVRLLFSPGLALADGVLEIRIKDHREAIGDFAQLTITLDKIAISPKAGLKLWRSGWKELAPVSRTVDLTQYTGKTSAQVFRGRLADGSFDGVDVRLRQIVGLLKNGSRAANIKNSTNAVKLPFEIAANKETVIVLDFVVLDMSDHPPQGYELGVRGWELYGNGKLIAKVPPA